MADTIISHYGISVTDLPPILLGFVLVVLSAVVLVGHRWRSRGAQPPNDR